MNVITTLKEKRVEKRLKFERQLLRYISLNILKDRVQKYFHSSHLTTGILMNAGIEEACYDVAIEAYLLGGEFSKFGFYGESMEEIRRRCGKESKHLIDTLYNFLLYWGEGNESVASEGLYSLCENFVECWWSDGFENGERQYKLRLH